MEDLVFKWFFFFYFVLAVGFTVLGVIGLVNPGPAAARFELLVHSPSLPPSFRFWLRNALLFGIVSLLLAFIDTQWMELAYSLWVLIVSFTIGKSFVQWEAFSSFWKQNPSQATTIFIQKLSAFLLLNGGCTFLFLYLLASG